MAGQATEMNPVLENLGSTSEALQKTADHIVDTQREVSRTAEGMRGTEGSTHEIHLALDRVKGEVEVLAQWLNEAAKPLRAGLADVDGPPPATRGAPTPAPRSRFDIAAPRQHDR